MQNNNAPLEPDVFPRGQRCQDACLTRVPAHHGKGPGARLAAGLDPGVGLESDEQRGPGPSVFAVRPGHGGRHVDDREDVVGYRIGNEFHPAAEDPALAIDDLERGGNCTRGRRARPGSQADAHQINRDSDIRRAVIKPAKERNEVGRVGRVELVSRHGRAQRLAARIKAKGDRPREEGRGIGRAILSIRAGQAERTRERRPGNVPPE